MRIITDLNQWVEFRKQVPAHLSISFVPTMGALHEGHAKLMRIAAKSHPISVLSIFVNPTQFGPNEDLSKYPRTLESDIEIARAAGISAVFVPTEKMLYPDGYSTFVQETELSAPLCGVYRPVHFKGVTTIVLKLLNIIQPTESFFGLKDAQQFLVISKMVRDLNLQTFITGVHTVRETTGLALSSRNRYLSDELRNERAPFIYKALSEARDLILDGVAVETVEKSATEMLSKNGFQVQYFETRTLPNLVRGNYSESPLVIATAALIDGTRLIDNIIFGPLENSGLRIFNEN